MRLVVLIDNYTINGRNLKGEGGASYYIEDEDKKFLLDTGASGLFMENAKNLDINLDDIGDKSKIYLSLMIRYLL